MSVNAICQRVFGTRWGFLAITTLLSPAMPVWALNPGDVTITAIPTFAAVDSNNCSGGDVLTALIGPGAVAGQILKVTINYAFGNPAAGADAMIQPVGNVLFDSSCFRLLSADITASTFTAGPLTTNDNRLYFTSVSGGSSNTLTSENGERVACACGIVAA